MYGTDLLTGKWGKLPSDQATYITACDLLIEATKADDFIAQWLCEAVIGAIRTQWAADSRTSN